MRLSAVFSCQKIIAESVAMLPLILYRRTGKNRNPAIEMPLYSALYLLANPEMTSFDFRAAMTGRAVRTGNAFAQIVRDGAGRVIELWPLLRGEVRVARDEMGELIYVLTRADGSRRVFQRSEILHLKGLSGDGMIGYSPISEARNAFEQGAVQDEYSRAFYANGGRPGGVLEVPELLDDEAYGRIKESWNEAHGGAENVGKIAILEQGTKYNPVSVSQSDQQFLEQKKLTRDEIAAIFRVPSHMLNSAERATFASVEESGQQFVTYCLGAWITQWEQTVARDCLVAEQRTIYYAKHTVQALLRGNNASRAEFYSKGLLSGWTNINEVRDLEDLNPITGGDTNFVPLNMAPLSSVVSPQPQQPAQRSEEHVCTCGQAHEERSEQRAAGDATETLRVGRVRLANAQKSLFEDAAKRMVKREVRDVQKAVEKYLRKRGAADFLAWLDDFYRNSDFTSAVKDAFWPILRAYAEQVANLIGDELSQDAAAVDVQQFISDYLDNVSIQWSAGSRTQLENLLADDGGADPAAAIEAQLAHWDAVKPGVVAQQQAYESLNAMSVAIYQSFDVPSLRWVASGKSCPFCQKLSGRRVKTGGFFVEHGHEIDGGAVAGVMQVKNSRRHAPLHGGCDCIVTAG